MSIFPYVHFCHVFIWLQLCEIIFCGEKGKRIQSSSSMVDWKLKKKKTLMCIQSQTSLSFASHVTEAPMSSPHVTETPMSSPQFPLCLCPSAHFTSHRGGWDRRTHSASDRGIALTWIRLFSLPPWVALKIGERVGSPLHSWVSPSARRRNWSLRSQVKAGWVLMNAWFFYHLQPFSTCSLITK